MFGFDQMRWYQRVDYVIDDISCCVLTGSRVAQTWFRQNQVAASSMYLRESVVTRFRMQRKNRRVDFADARQGERCRPAVFSQADDATFTPALDQHKAFPAAANADDAAGLDHIIQPLLKHFHASLRQRLTQSRA